MAKTGKRTKKTVVKRKTVRKTRKTKVQQYQAIVKGRDVVAGRDIKQYFSSTSATDNVSAADARTARNFASQGFKAATSQAFDGGTSWQNPPAFSSPYSEWSRPNTQPNFGLASRANTNPQVGSSSQANTQGEEQSIRQPPPRLRGSGRSGTSSSTFGVRAPTIRPGFIGSATDRLMLSESGSSQPSLRLHRREDWSDTSASEKGKLRTEAEKSLFGKTDLSGLPRGVSASSKSEPIIVAGFGSERAGIAREGRPSEEQVRKAEARAKSEPATPLKGIAKARAIVDRKLKESDAEARAQAQATRGPMGERSAAEGTSVRKDIPSMTSADARRRSEERKKNIVYTDAQGKLKIQKYKPPKLYDLTPVKEAAVESDGFSSSSGYDIPTTKAGKSAQFARWRLAGFTPKDKPEGQRNSKNHRWNYKKGRWDTKGLPRK